MFYQPEHLILALKKDIFIKNANSDVEIKMLVVKSCIKDGKVIVCGEDLSFAILNGIES